MERILCLYHVLCKRQRSTGAQRNAFWRLMGHPPAAEKLGCVVGASDMIMSVNG